MVTGFPLFDGTRGDRLELRKSQVRIGLRHDVFTRRTAMREVAMQWFRDRLQEEAKNKARKGEISILREEAVGGYPTKISIFNTLAVEFRESHRRCQTSTGSLKYIEIYIRGQVSHQMDL